MISPSTTCSSWINIVVDPGSIFHSTNQIKRDKFTVYIKFRLRTRVKYIHISVIHISLPSDFRGKLWVGLGFGVGIGQWWRKY